MDIIEEEERLVNPSRAEKITVSRRDTVLNDLKNSTLQGLLSFLFSMSALILLLFGIYHSYTRSGQAGILTGALLFGTLIIAVLSLIFGILGLKNRKKIRHYMEKRGIILSTVVIVLLVLLYLRGIQLIIS